VLIGMIMINGLFYIPNYLNPVEHDELMQHIDQAVWLTLLRRRVQHYGYLYNYKSKTLSKSDYLGKLPLWAQTLAERLYADRLMSKPADQVVVNEYKPGQGIAPHVDCVPCFGGDIISISLGSACLMDFTRGGDKHALLLEPRSLLVMRGEARYQWRHGIAPRKTDSIGDVEIIRERRISVTLRSVTL